MLKVESAFNYFYKAHATFKLIMEILQYTSVYCFPHPLKRDHYQF